MNVACFFGSVKLNNGFSCFALGMYQQLLKNLQQINISMYLKWLIYFVLSDQTCVNLVGRKHEIQS